MSKVYIALQDNEESRYIVEAIEEDNPEAVVNYQPAMIRVENERYLVITLGGNVDEDEDMLSLTWNQ